MDQVIEDKNVFPDFKFGPLSAYREKSTMDYRKLRLAIKGEEVLRLQRKICDFLLSNPLYAHPQGTLTLDEYRHLTMKRIVEYVQQDFWDFELFLKRPDLERAVMEILMLYDPSMSAKLGLGYIMFPNVLRTLGTDRLMKYVEANYRGEIGGAFALTEVAHGTNTKKMRTTATYDLKSKEFIIHTPDFEAAKCWVGNLGKTCTHAVVYAQLYTPDGECHGLNAFLVPIRCTKTLQAFPGIIVGDIGEKIGMRAIDNGFVMFNNYHIPRENLLARTGDVTEDGEYVTSFKDMSKRMAAAFGALSGGRVNICHIACSYLAKAITIAIRYSGARKQFGPDENGPEFPVLEYQSQQYRLLPHLATAFAIDTFSRWLAPTYNDMLNRGAMGDDVVLAAMELHALSSAAKPVCTWSARNGIQDCRESCGGHGYLKASQLGELRNDNDAAITYEGENAVLTQQASNWLLNLWRKGVKAFKEASPLGSADFLADFDQLMKLKFNYTSIAEVLDPKNILITMNWLCAYQLQKTARYVEKLSAQGKTRFEVRNDSQALNAITLAVIYGERMVFKTFYERVLSWSEIPNEQRVLLKLVALHGLEMLRKHLSILYEGGFANGPQASELYQEAVLRLLPEIKENSIALVDTLAPPDFILNSPLGMSDGDVYKHLESTIMLAPDALQRVTWWKDVVAWKGAKL